MSELDKLIKRWDVVRFLRRRGLEVRLSDTGEVHIRCPRCHDSKYRLYVNRHSYNWICHNCSGRGRGAISYVKWVMNCEDAQAIKELVASSGPRSIRDLDDEPARPKVDKTKIVPLPPEYKKLALPADRRSEPYWNYLIERSIPPSMVRAYDMGYCRRGYYRDRIILPVDIFGVRRGWIARSILPDVKRKYLNPPEIHTSRLLFNLDAVIASGSDKVVLMEGYFDALRLPDIAVCTFGKKISLPQIDMLCEAGFRKWVFCYDGDATADAEHYSEVVPSYVECYRAELPLEYDPGNAPLLTLSRAIKNADLWNLGSI